MKKQSNKVLKSAAWELATWQYRICNILRSYWPFSKTKKNHKAPGSDGIIIDMFCEKMIKVFIVLLSN